MSNFRANGLAEQVKRNEYFEIDTLPAHLKVVLIGRLADSLAVDHRTMRDAFWGPDPSPGALPQLDATQPIDAGFRAGLNLASEGES